ncbi:hypothetical protein IMCC3317_22820 [Kordia antarctica]|uniref:DUF6705 domain-containing protein n=1 Tax=Kordia antarctica TaxID=1218801 RepID=A0A7L4ZJV1_9FLAO|nr:DUF6705 family protein [Kordia antarctica]QHI36912.1 hypothetical protein IMCC3317_22820 [Kordia antarctica]
MKTIIYILFGMFLTCGFAQQDETVSIHKLGNHDDQDYSKSYYYKDINNDLDKFVGTWKYDDGNKKLTLVFYKDVHATSGKDYSDEIYARFKYEENGTVIYNTLSDFSASSKLRITGSGFYPNSTTKMNLHYAEPTNIPYDRVGLKGLKYSPSLDIEYLPCVSLGCSPQLKWDLFFVRASASDPIPFKIPFDLTLTKQ